MKYKKILSIVDSAFQYYEKGLIKLRKETIDELHNELEQAFAEGECSKFLSTDVKESGEKIRSTR